MERPFPAYEGDAPFLFVSYAHDDDELVFVELVLLHEAGFNLWYDEGIHAGSVWRQTLADAIANSAAVVFFSTANSVESEFCQKEINFALDEKKTVFVVQFDDTSLPRQLRMSLNSRQALVRSSYDELGFRNRLVVALDTLLKEGQIGTLPETIQGKVDDLAGKVDLAALKSIAVLPLKNMSTDEETGFFAAGLSEDILDKLAANKDIKVASRSAAFQLDQQGDDHSVIARKLNVSYLLEGSVRKMGDNLRITIQLIRTIDGFNVWSKTYDRKLSGGFDMQSTVAQYVAHLVRSELSFDIRRNYFSEYPRYRNFDPEAVKQFLNALNEYRLIRLGEGGDWTLRERYLQEAIQIDPTFSEGYMMLSDCYITRLGGKMPFDEARSLAHKTVNKAIELEPNSFFATLEQARIFLYMDLDYAKAQTLFQECDALVPNVPWFYFFLSRISLREGRVAEALRLMASAHTMPAGVDLHTLLYGYAWILLVVGDYEKSLRMSNDALKVAESGHERAIALRTKISALISLNRAHEAKDLMQEAWDIDGSVYPETYAFQFAKLGDNERALKILTDPRHDQVDWFYVALGYVSLGDLDAAFPALETGIRERSELIVDSLLVAEFWEPLRSDNRFEALHNLLESQTIHTRQYLAQRES